jgi:uncharacterized protein with HEPN domain
MPSKNPQGALLDILDNIALSRSFVAGLTFDRFKDDKKTVYATVRCLEIISETDSKFVPTWSSQLPISSSIFYLVITTANY